MLELIQRRGLPEQPVAQVRNAKVVPGWFRCVYVWGSLEGALRRGAGVFLGGFVFWLELCEGATHSLRHVGEQLLCVTA